MIIFYLVMLSVAFLTPLTLLVSLNRLTGALVLNQCFEYLLYLVFECCQHSLIIY